MNDKKILVFIFNADSSPFKQAFDFFKRLGYPQTYQCNLTKLTHDGLNMKKEWQSFVQTLPIKTKFYHRDMFKKKYSDYKTEFPVALLIENDKFKNFITAGEMGSFGSMQELMDAVTKKINASN